MTLWRFIYDVTDLSGVTGNESFVWLERASDVFQIKATYQIRETEWLTAIRKFSWFQHSTTSIRRLLLMQARDLVCQLLRWALGFLANIESLYLSLWLPRFYCNYCWSCLLVLEHVKLLSTFAIKLENKHLKVYLLNLRIYNYLGRIKNCGCCSALTYCSVRRHRALLALNWCGSFFAVVFTILIGFSDCI